MRDKQIEFWAHMLDESRHESYYDVYMMEHPEDQLPKLIDDLIGEFAKSLKKDGIDLQKCLKGRFVNFIYLKDLEKKLKSKYYWQRIKSQQYAAIVSRFIALSDRAKGQKFNETDEITYDNVAHMVPKRKLEECLDIICHNTNVLEANNCIVNSLDRKRPLPTNPRLIDSMKKHVDAAFSKHGIPKLWRHDSWYDEDVEDYFAAIQLYTVWGSYAKGRAGEEYICDSDNGPEAIKKVLDNIDYAGDEVDLVVGLNKALDVVHFRSDLAAAFIEGGQATCALVSNLPSKFVV